MTPITVSRRELAARLVAWTGLAGVTRAGVAATVERLGAVQLDPMQVVAPAHLWTLSLRRGVTTADDLDRALRTGELVEAYCHARCLVHRNDVDGLVAGWRRRRAQNAARRYGVEAAAARVMRRAESGEAFMARELDDGERVAGFWDAESERRTKATSVAVDLLWAEGRLMVVGRRGGQKVYQLTARQLPEIEARIAALSDDEANWAAARHAWRCYGVVTRDMPVGWGAVRAAGINWLERGVATGDLVPLGLDTVGAPPVWAVSALLRGDSPAFRRTLLLAPVDNLLWHRPRLEWLFGFRYRWDAYTPAAKRAGGVYNMPVLAPGRFCGEADARWSDGRLHVAWRAGASDGPPPPAVMRAVQRAEALCRALRTADTAQETGAGTTTRG